MKTRSVLAFGAALSAGALLTVGLRSPQPARSQGVPAPFHREGASAPAMPPALIKRRQEQLRDFLEAHEVKGAKVQDVLTRYFGELQRGRADVFAANRALLATLHTSSGSKTSVKPASDAQVQEAVKTYQEAIKGYEEARTEDEKNLSKSLGNDWTPRVRALLIGMGASGEAAPIVPMWGAFATEQAPQVAAKKTERAGMHAVSDEVIEKIRKANEACCGGNSQDTQPSKAIQPRLSGPVKAKADAN